MPELRLTGDYTSSVRCPLRVIQPGQLSLPSLSGRYISSYNMVYGTGDQWSLRKAGTMGTLASQAEIDVWLQTPGTLQWRSAGLTSEKNFWDFIWKIMQSSAFLAGNWLSTPSKMRLLNALTMETSFPRVPARNDTIKRQIKLRMTVWSHVRVRCRVLSLRPVRCTPASSVI